MSRVRFALYFFALSVCATAAFASTVIGRPVPVDSLESAADLPYLPYGPARMPGWPHTHAKETRLVLASAD